MPLSPDQIKELQAKKNAPARAKTAQVGGKQRGVKRKFTRLQTQFARLPRNHVVSLHQGGSLRCESVGCGCPTLYIYRGEPVCGAHLIIMLVHEVNLLSRNGTVKTDGVAPDFLLVVGDTPSVTAVAAQDDTSSEMEPDGYL